MTAGPPADHELPIEPKDVGRSYGSVTRVNSQSGKGGIAYVIEAHYGLSLPRPLQVELARPVQAEAHRGDREDTREGTASELGAEQLWGGVPEGVSGPPEPARPEDAHDVRRIR